MSPQNTERSPPSTSRAKLCLPSTGLHSPSTIEYSVRNCRELGGDIKNLNIHAGPKGCKGYNKGYAMAFHPPLRICVCEEEKAARLEREERKRTAPPKMTVQEAMNPNAQELCKRFPNGKCGLSANGRSTNTGD